ncbi:MAG: hypothetical protein AB7G15_03460, partial [Alphaproteobacteria bacterium]
MVRRVVLGVLLAAVLLAANPAVQAASRKIDVPLHGYSLAVPDGWRDAPDSVFAGMVGAMAKRGAVADLAFIRTGAKPADQSVIAVVRVDLTVIGDVDFNDLRQQANAFTRDTTRQLDGLSRAVRSPVKSYRIGALDIDETTRSFTLAMRMEFERMGTIAYRIRGFVGRNHLILVYMFATDAFVATGESAFDALTASFRFTPEAAHPQSVFADATRAAADREPVSGPSLLELFAFGALVLLSLGCLLYMIALLRRR